MTRTSFSLIACVLAAAAAPAFALPIPYNHVGTVAPTTSVIATGGSLDLYFYGSSAADNDNIIVTDVTSGWSSGAILGNHSTAVGTPYTFSPGSYSISAGDVIEFELVNLATGKTYSSIPTDSADGYNHAYMTAYPATGPSAVAGIPAGEFVGFEDLYIGTTNGTTCGGSNNKSDCDYNDDEFVFVQTSPTPEPGSLALLGSSVLGAAGLLRRRFKQR